MNEPQEKIKEKIEKYFYRGFEPHFKKIKLYPHVKETICKFKAASLKLGLLSDLPPKTKLKNLGINEYWDVILCSEETGALKPAQQPFLALAEALGCPPEEILYVGNSVPYDITGAKRAGMKTALITKKRSQIEPAPDFTFHDYRHLSDFVLQ